jgi:type VI secretion system secreted protein VgrG
MSATFSQSERPIGVDTPLGKDALLLTRFAGTEEFSRLFRYELEFLSQKDDHSAAKIVGQPVSFWVEFPNKEKRYFHGICQRFSYAGTGDRLSIYRATVVPWFWLLSRTSDCRIFQEKSVPDIIGEVLGELGFADKLDKSGVKGDHPKWDYCVQYRETDFNFLSRLMEEEGIFYYFKHEQGKHTLVLGDSNGAYKDCQDKELRMPTNLAQPGYLDNLLSWEHNYEFRTGKWAHKDYNFETPATDLLVDTTGTLPVSDTKKYELFDYPGDYEKKPVGDGMVKLRIEQEEAGYDVVKGESYCRSFNPGGKFKVDKHHNKGEAGKGYVITSVRHEAQVDGYVTGSQPIDRIYHNSFTCIPDKTVFRPERLTPKPAIHGVQTAVVTGPSGEEIHTDKYGRIKVQFHWDRLGKKDDKSSCWIRCSQGSAGKGWGAMYLPRIGQEVVVTYLEGDPDRPLVTGVVYNAQQMPAYKLPDEKTKSYFKSNSSKGGNGFNEIRFEDLGGKEQILMHAQKDMHVKIKNDHRETVHNDQHLWVKANQKAKVDADAHLTIGSNLKQKVGQKVSLEATSVHTKASSDLAIEAGTIHIKAAQTLVIEAGMQLSLKVGGNFVDISVAGVAINGTAVLINSGGAAGSGMGCSPDAPEAPDEADDGETAKSGQKSAP